jgi:hypothetical protein
MEISVNEFVELSNSITAIAQKHFGKGVETEKERPLPNNLFEALLEYGKKSKTLIDYHKSSGKSDGCNWIQIKPTRSGKTTDLVEISFEENLTEIHHVGISKM